ncbi:MAG: sigma 54-interacting transcriptional regulator [Clostridia bacterium]|jgi:PAS domain S-box-containing protein|nr:sigma 54-interacting transcriptional regulator [Clostridia bacterium]
MGKIKVGIIGTDNEGLFFLEALTKVTQVELIGVADNGDINFSAEKYQIKYYKSIKDLIENDQAQLYFVSTSLQQEFYQISKDKTDNQQVVTREMAQLLKILVSEREGLRKIKGELSAILSSVQEAIEVADKDGTIRYVNPAFSRVTGIPECDRINKNIFAVSPNGALAKSLLTSSPIFGRRSKVGGSGVEVISNASPIIVDGDITGAVVVFQPINDFYKLMEELQKSNTIIENLYAKIGQISGAKYTFEDLIGGSNKFIASLAMAKKAAKSDTTVLILGESGTGKELFAHAIHQASSRREKPFIKANCAAIPENLLESEFFGHEKGAFTGALQTKLGKFELATGGTLFLDEIGDMNLLLQAKILRVLQEQEIERVGGTQIISIDVRIIAATNRKLMELVEQGKFREDLYYRLNVIELNIPSLRERMEDFNFLSVHIINKINRKLGKKITGIDPDAVSMMKHYEWPGNIRELENVLERVMVVIENDRITANDLSYYLEDYHSIKDDSHLIIPLDEVEQKMIDKAIKHFGDSLAGKKKAAKKLNISLATLYNKLKKYNFKN